MDELLDGWVEGWIMNEWLEKLMDGWMTSYV